MVPSSCPKAVATRSPTFGDLLLTELQCAEDPDLGRPAYGGGRPTSSLHAERLGNRCSVSRRSRGYNGRGRATPIGHRSPAGEQNAALPRARRRRAKNGRKGLGAFLSHSVGAFVPMLGELSQALDRNGANGFMVLRLRVSWSHDAGSCSLVRCVRQNRPKRP